MNEAEKRRRELLEQTRYSYQESGIPAIHPRYRASYSELYGEEEAEQGSLGIRTFICMILFAVFVFMQNEGKDILHIRRSVKTLTLPMCGKKYHRGVDLRPLVKN